MPFVEFTAAHTGAPVSVEPRSVSAVLAGETPQAPTVLHTGCVSVAVKEDYTTVIDKLSGEE